MPPSRNRRAKPSASTSSAAARASSSSSATTLIYPSGAQSANDLTPSEALLKVARHSRCSASGGDCVCSGLRPNPESDVEAKSVRGAAASRNWDTRDENCARQWRRCGVCGHDSAAHGSLNDSEGGEEERIRRIKVAIRLDELLEDQNKLLDFAYTDENLESLQKQLPALAMDDEGQPSGRSSSARDERNRKRTRSGTQSVSAHSPSPAPSGIESRGPPTRSSSPNKRRRVGPASASNSTPVPVDDSPITTPSDEPPAPTPPPPPADDEADPDGQDTEGVSVKTLAQEGEFNGEEADASSETQEVGQGHGKHPAQSSKGVANQDIGPEEAAEKAKEQEKQEAEEETIKQKFAEPGADIGLATGGVSIDPVEQQALLEEAPAPKRERPAITEERTGLIEFRVVSNANLSKTTPSELVILTGLKNIFQRQLPKMPREYITRLVLDKNHVSMAIVKRGLQVVGGITYRPFNKRRFAEIVFCAIDSSQQVKGYGQHLMNHLKDHVKESSDVMHFLTYADNYAIGYFKKQGFTKEISLPRSVWVGYIKDYEGGTLMQCSMVPRVRYLEVHDLLTRQKELILTKIRSISKSHIVHPGLAIFKQLEAEGKLQPPEDIQAIDDATNGLRPPANGHDASSKHGYDDASSEAYVTSVKSSFKIDPSSVPGLRDSGWTPEMDVLSRRPKRGPHHGLMRSILVELTNHQSSWPFQTPVNADEVPDYYRVIKQPMDLSTMESKLEANRYKHVDDLVNDAHLIFDNCKSYNPRNSPYAKCAEKLERFLKDNLIMWKQGAGLVA